jgi:hypothetical protein
VEREEKWIEKKETKEEKRNMRQRREITEHVFHQLN